MIELLQLGREQGWERLERVVGLALEIGGCEAAAVKHLLLTEQQERSGRRRELLVEVGELARFDRPLPGMSEYDRLLAGEVLP